MTIDFKAVKIYYRDADRPEHLLSRVVWMRSGEKPTIESAGRTIHALTGLMCFRIVEIVDNYEEAAI